MFCNIKFSLNSFQCGWYWGPISGETAEKLLAGEPDGSFVVRDSSDEHYIFSLTFKLNGLVRHVRIEHDHGKFFVNYLKNYFRNFCSLTFAFIILYSISFINNCYNEIFISLLYGKYSIQSEPRVSLPLFIL